MLATAGGHSTVSGNATLAAPCANTAAPLAAKASSASPTHRRCCMCVPKLASLQEPQSLHHVAHDLFALAGRAHVELRIHPARDALARQRRLIFLAQRGILPVIGDGAATLREIDRAKVHKLLAWP